MSALVLPPPKSATNGLDGANGHSGDDTPASSSAPPKTSKYIEGLIYPPPDIRSECYTLHFSAINTQLRYARRQP